MKSWFEELLRSFDSHPTVCPEEVFRGKYRLFLRLLDARKEALARSASPLRADVEAAFAEAGQVLAHLDELAERPHPDLCARLRRIEDARPAGADAAAGLEDLLNAAHDLAVDEVSSLPDKYNTDRMPVKKVRTGLPINLHVLDLEGALPADSGRLVAGDRILSLPLQAMFRGMNYPGVTWSGPIGLNLKGLMVIMAQSSSRPEEHFWDKTLALISLEYMSYHSRLGYHYATVDANLSGEARSNHVRFTFQGGAADAQRKARRARFIGTVLERTGFDVKVEGDLVQAGFPRRPGPETEEKLDLLGRLMGCSRQRDMVMDDEAIVSWHVDAFLRGNYSFSPES